MENTLEFYISDEMIEFVNDHLDLIPSSKIEDHKWTVSAKEFVKFTNEAIKFKIKEYNDKFFANLKFEDLLVDKVWPHETDWIKEFDIDELNYYLHKRINDDQPDMYQVGMDFVHSFLTEEFRYIFLNYTVHGHAFMAAIDKEE